MFLRNVLLVLAALLVGRIVYLEMERDRADREVVRRHEQKLLELALAQRERAVLAAQLEFEKRTNQELRRELDTLKGSR